MMSMSELDEMLIEVEQAVKDTLDEFQNMLMGERMNIGIAQQQEVQNGGQEVENLYGQNGGYPT